MMLKIAKHKYGGSRVWWYIPVTPGTQEAEQEDHKFEVSLSQNKKGWQCSSVVEGPWFQSPVLKKEGKEKKKKRTNRGNSVVTQRQNSVSWFWSSPSEH